MYGDINDFSASTQATQPVQILLQLFPASKTERKKIDGRSFPLYVFTHTQHLLNLRPGPSGSSSSLRAAFFQ